MSRYHKFTYFFEDILKVEANYITIDHLLNSFSKYCVEILTEKSLLINDTVNFIESSYQNIQMFVVSGSDQVELRKLCSELDIEHFFKAIYGSSASKIELVERVLDDQKCAKQEVVLIGDSVNDQDAAEVNGITFYACNNLSLVVGLNFYINCFDHFFVKDKVGKLQVQKGVYNNL